MISDVLLNQTGFEIKRFDELTEPYMMALVWYMTCDGEAWKPLGDIGSVPFGDREALVKAVREALPSYTKKYGHRLFGVTIADSDLVKAGFMSDREIESDFARWEDYHGWYIKNGGIPSHGPQDRWPVILSGFPDELLQDGNHRCHSYLAAGHADIPVVFYLAPRHKKSKLTGTPIKIKNKY